jgi:hypothetical protein
MVNAFSKAIGIFVEPPAESFESIMSEKYCRLMGFVLSKGLTCVAEEENVMSETRSLLERSGRRI